MAEQFMTNKRTERINLLYHYVREEVIESKSFEMESVATKANTSDIFTIPLDRGHSEVHRDTLLRSFSGYLKWRSTRLYLGQGFSGTVDTGFPFEHVWSQDAHVFGALQPAVSQWNATTLRSWLGRRAAAASWSAATARTR